MRSRICGLDCSEHFDVHFVLLWALGTLSGCAYMNPYVPMPLNASPASTSMPQLSGAITKIDKSLQSTEMLRNSVSHTQRTLNLMTFGFGFAAGASSIYGAHRDAVTGLGLAASATYAGGALFAPADQTTLYNNAIKALVCVRTKAESLASIVVSSDQRRNMDLRDGFIHGQLSPVGCAPQGPLNNAVQNADRARVKAIAALDGAKIADQSAATSAENATLNVITALNDELSKRAANGEAVLAAARTAVAMATGIGAAPAQDPKPAGLPGAAFAPLAIPPVCSAPTVEEIQAIEARYKVTEATINSALNALAALDSSCVFNAPAITVFAVGQEQIVLAKDASYIVTASGGRTPYSAQWVGAQPSGVTFQLVAGTVVLSAGASAKSGTSYILEVTDSSLVANRKSITVKVQ